MYRHLALLITAALLVLAVAGCGSSDDGGGDAASAETQAPAIAKAAFIKKADAICKATSKKILTEGPRAVQEGLEEEGGSQKEVEVNVVATVSLPLFQDEVDEIRALGIPTGDAAEVEAMLDETQEVLDQAKDDPEAYMAAQANFKHPYRPAEKLYRAYGISRCPQG